MRENLEWFHIQHNNVEAKKSKRDRKIPGIKPIVHEKDNTINELRRTVTGF